MDDKKLIEKLKNNVFKEKETTAEPKRKKLKIINKTPTVQAIENPSDGGSEDTTWLDILDKIKKIKWPNTNVPNIEKLKEMLHQAERKEKTDENVFSKLTKKPEDEDDNKNYEDIQKNNSKSDSFEISFEYSDNIKIIVRNFKITSVSFENDRTVCGIIENLSDTDFMKTINTFTYLFNNQKDKFKTKIFLVFSDGSGKRQIFRKHCGLESYTITEGCDNQFYISFKLKY